ncbi:MSMEG_1061 family FMN-dependent PPOX-type flavoprotein [Paenibacillus sp. strain BS8-2]
MEKLDISQHLVGSLEELRDLVGTPHEAVVLKSVSIIDEQARGYIAQSPMVFVASSNEKGQCDVSPRGDAPGFVYVAHESQLIIPDRPGNKRADTLSNILSNPHVGLLFVIPGMQEVMRVNGKAHIIRDHPVLEKLALRGKAPTIGIVVEVEECFIHCPRALKHAGLWDADTWPAQENLPSSQEMFHAHLRINGYDI